MFENVQGVLNWNYRYEYPVNSDINLRYTSMLVKAQSGISSQAVFDLVPNITYE